MLACVLAGIAGLVPAVVCAAGAASLQGPVALAVAKDGKTLYVANHDARQVAWLALPEGEVVRRIDLPAAPTGLALTAAGDRLIVTCAAPQSTVAVLDAISGDRLAAIPAGHTACGPAVTPDGRRVYVCNRFSGDVSVIDLEIGREVARIRAGREPVTAAATPDGRSVLVANHLPASPTDRPYQFDVCPVLTRIDTATHATTTIQLPHGAHSLRGLCILPDGKHALVTHLLGNFERIPFRVDMGWINVNVVSVVDLAQDKVISTIGMDDVERGSGNPCDVTCTADGSTVCVSLAGTHELCLIARDDLLGDVAQRTMQPMMTVWPIYPSLGASLWRHVKLPGNGPRGLAVSDPNIYVAEYFSDTVAVVKTGSLEVAGVSTIALGPAPQRSQRRWGEMLFNDATICYQKWQSCASCHPDGRVDGLNWDLQNDGTGNSKNTKSMLLSHRTPPSMASGVRATAEKAVRSGLTHILFSERPEKEAVAIDIYLKSLQPVPSPYLEGGKLSPAAERGKELFHNSRVGCYRCHPAPLYTDLKSHDVGSGTRADRREAFDTPTLVEVWRTAPYLHDGRYTTLKKLLVEGRHGLHGSRAKNLTEQDLADLAEFVLSL